MRKSSSANCDFMQEICQSFLWAATLHFLEVHTHTLESKPGWTIGVGMIYIVRLAVGARMIPHECRILLVGILDGLSIATLNLQ